MRSREATLFRFVDKCLELFILDRECVSLVLWILSRNYFIAVVFDSLTHLLSNVRCMCQHHIEPVAAYTNIGEIGMPYFLRNLGWNDWMSDWPTMSSHTSTCPLHPLPEPIPIVGTRSFFVMKAATLSGMHSRTNWQMILRPEEPRHLPRWQQLGWQCALEP